MKRILVYLNGIRGLHIIEKLIQCKYKNLIIFSSKSLKELDTFKNNANIQINISKNINTKKHYNLVKKLKPHVSIVAGFSQIFQKNLIDLPTFGTINLHAGPLPKYRGGSPLNWQIINGEKYIGISLIKMNEGIDEGLILKEKNFLLKEKDDIQTVHNKVNKLFPILLVSLLKEIFNKKEKKKKQIEKFARYWHQRSDIDGKIDWSLMNCKKVHNLIRALTKPYNGAYTSYKTFKIRIYKSRICNKRFFGSPGRVVKIKNNNLLVICADYGLCIEEYKFESSNKKLKNGMHLS